MVKYMSAKNKIKNSLEEKSRKRIDKINALQKKRKQSNKSFTKRPSKVQKAKNYQKITNSLGKKRIYQSKVKKIAVKKKTSKKTQIKLKKKIISRDSRQSVPNRLKFCRRKICQKDARCQSSSTLRRNEKIKTNAKFLTKRLVQSENDKCHLPWLVVNRPIMTRNMKKKLLKWLDLKIECNDVIMVEQDSSMEIDEHQNSLQNKHSSFCSSQLQQHENTVFGKNSVFPTSKKDLNEESMIPQFYNQNLNSLPSLQNKGYTEAIHTTSNMSVELNNDRFETMCQSNINASKNYSTYNEIHEKFMNTMSVELIRNPTEITNQTITNFALNDSFHNALSKGNMINQDVEMINQDDVNLFQEESPQNELIKEVVSSGEISLESISPLNSSTNYSVGSKLYENKINTVLNKLIGNPTNGTNETIMNSAQNDSFQTALIKRIMDTASIAFDSNSVEMVSVDDVDLFQEDSPQNELIKEVVDATSLEFIPLLNSPANFSVGNEFYENKMDTELDKFIGNPTKRTNESIKNSAQNNSFKKELTKRSMDTTSIEFDSNSVEMINQNNVNLFQEDSPQNKLIKEVVNAMSLESIPLLNSPTNFLIGNELSENKMDTALNKVIENPTNRANETKMNSAQNDLLQNALTKRFMDTASIEFNSNSVMISKNAVDLFRKDSTQNELIKEVVDEMSLDSIHTLTAPIDFLVGNELYEIEMNTEVNQFIGNPTKQTNETITSSAKNDSIQNVLTKEIIDTASIEFDSKIAMINKNAVKLFQEKSLEDELPKTVMDTTSLETICNPIDEMDQILTSLIPNNTSLNEKSMTTELTSISVELSRRNPSTELMEFSLNLDEESSLVAMDVTPNTRTNEMSIEEANETHMLVENIIDTTYNDSLQEKSFEEQIKKQNLVENGGFTDILEDSLCSIEFPSFSTEALHDYVAKNKHSNKHEKLRQLSNMSLKSPIKETVDSQIKNLDLKIKIKGSEALPACLEVPTSPLSSSLLSLTDSPCESLMNISSEINAQTQVTKKFSSEKAFGNVELFFKTLKKSSIQKVTKEQDTVKNNSLNADTQEIFLHSDLKGNLYNSLNASYEKYFLEQNENQNLNLHEPNFIDTIEHSEKISTIDSTSTKFPISKSEEIPASKSILYEIDCKSHAQKRKSFEIGSLYWLRHKNLEDNRIFSLKNILRNIEPTENQPPKPNKLNSINKANSSELKGKILYNKNNSFSPSNSVKVNKNAKEDAPIYNELITYNKTRHLPTHHKLFNFSLKNHFIEKENNNGNQENNHNQENINHEQENNVQYSKFFPEQNHPFIDIMDKQRSKFEKSLNKHKTINDTHILKGNTMIVNSLKRKESPGKNLQKTDKITQFQEVCFHKTVKKPVKLTRNNRRTIPYSYGCPTCKVSKVYQRQRLNFKSTVKTKYINRRRNETRTNFSSQTSENFKQNETSLLKQFISTSDALSSVGLDMLELNEMPVCQLNLPSVKYDYLKLIKLLSF